VVNLPLAHDLLWGMTPAQLPANAPQWAIAALEAGQPVVVRRALSEEGLVAVGVRGVLREQRLATFMPLDSIACRVSPEALCHVECERDLPVMQGLKQLRPLLDGCGWVWGVSGSVGFELASGFRAMHAASDLDLILRAPQMITRNQANSWSFSIRLCAGSTCNCKRRSALWPCGNGPAVRPGCC